MYKNDFLYKLHFLTMEDKIPQGIKDLIPNYGAVVNIPLTDKDVVLCMVKKEKEVVKEIEIPVSKYLNVIKVPATHLSCTIGGRYAIYYKNDKSTTVKHHYIKDVKVKDKVVNKLRKKIFRNVNFKTRSESPDSAIAGENLLNGLF